FCDVAIEPFGAAIDGFVDGGPVFFGELWFGLDERHDDERCDSRVEGVVGARGRGVDVEAFGVFGAAPGAVGALIGEQEFYAAVDGAGDLVGLWRRDWCGFGALGGERGDVWFFGWCCGGWFFFGGG